MGPGTGLGMICVETHGSCMHSEDGSLALNDSESNLSSHNPPLLYP